MSNYCLSLKGAVNQVNLETPGWIDRLPQDRFSFSTLSHVQLFFLLPPIQRQIFSLSCWIRGHQSQELVQVWEIPCSCQAESQYRLQSPLMPSLGQQLGSSSGPGAALCIRLQPQWSQGGTWFPPPFIIMLKCITALQWLYFAKTNRAHAQPMWSLGVSTIHEELVIEMLNPEFSWNSRQVS